MGRVYNYNILERMVGLYKKYLYTLFLLFLAFLILSNENAKEIIAGITIFLIGMVFMEDGFKLFSGGVLENILKKSTSNLPKSIFSGFLATSVVQSSSLLTIIVISFLSAELITLSGAVGVIFGSNIGTTTTAWIVSSFGVKIDIAKYALPMISFGVIFSFNKEKSYKGFGNILLGLGFVFLGIAYMKSGFDSLKDAIDLASLSIEGYLGVIVYVAVGALATIVIQSSSATMALIITALAAGQIEYYNALALAVGANIGTTVTAILGSIKSNNNAKRLAVAHLIFNMVTAVVAIVFLYKLADLVKYISMHIGIASDDYILQLALFHTIFNVLGVLLVSPFTKYLVKYLHSIFKEKSTKVKAKYLDKAVINSPEAALSAVKKEVQHLYDNGIEVISHALSLHRHKYIGSDDIMCVIEESTSKIDTNIDKYYEKHIKGLYSEILYFSTLAQEEMDAEQKDEVYRLKTSCRNIVEAIKNVRELQKNIDRYLHGKNEFVRNEYNNLRKNIAKTIDTIYHIRGIDDDLDIISKIKVLQEELEHFDYIQNGKIDALIRENKIDSKSATSLINDNSFTYNISTNLIESAITLWIKDKDIRSLGRGKK
jgi:phosphate:Na+ symporter